MLPVLLFLGVGISNLYGTTLEDDQNLKSTMATASDPDIVMKGTHTVFTSALAFIILLKPFPAGKSG
jgi:hypothetical protein